MLCRKRWPLSPHIILESILLISRDGWGVCTNALYRLNACRSVSCSPIPQRVGWSGWRSWEVKPGCISLVFGPVSQCFTWNVAGCCGRRKAGCDVSRETWVWWVRNVGVVSRETRPDSWGVGDSGWSVLPLPYWLPGGGWCFTWNTGLVNTPGSDSEGVKAKAVRAR